MQFRNVSTADLCQALHHANQSYGGNLVLNDVTNCGRYIRATLRTVRGGVEGSRTSAKGRKIPAASWEAHRDFLWALFDLRPDADVQSWMARYQGREAFVRQFPETANINVGSQARPVTIRELTV